MVGTVFGVVCVALKAKKVVGVRSFVFFCPGPALVLAGSRAIEGLIFVVFMLIGFRLADLVQARLS